MNSNKRKGANSTYFGDIVESVRSLSKGLGLTLKHIFQATKRRDNSYVSDKNYFNDKTGLVTLQYPYESLPVPDNGRYRLHNEIDDCIVCDKCAKICPVDCITIESIKATEEIGKTSDGTSKRLYAPIFDIDLAKCCYCGLCTTVCPTECLTMTKAYDFSEVDVDNFIYKFADMTAQQAEQKRKELELANAQKEAAKAAKAVPAAAKPEAKVEASGVAQPLVPSAESKPSVPRPAFKPKVKQGPAADPPKGLTGTTSEEIQPSQSNDEAKQGGVSETSSLPKPVFKPKIRPNPTTEPSKSQEQPTIPAETSSVSDVTSDFESKSEKQQESKPMTRPVFRPKVKAVIPPINKEEQTESPKIDETGTASSIQTTQDSSQKNTDSNDQESPKPITIRPLFRPKIRPKQSGENNKES